MSAAKQDRVIRALAGTVKLIAMVLVLRVLPPGEETTLINEAINKVYEILDEPEGNESMLSRTPASGNGKVGE
jgi:hypothetical protein